MEDHVATGKRVPLRESGEVGEGEATRPITIIKAGWGSSGYYGREMLERDGPAVFPSGTHMYLDHPTQSEEYERPERSVKELIGVTESSPFMAGDALKGTAKVFSHWRPFVNEVAPHIGLSIRAAGEVAEGEAEGRRGPIIEGLHEGISIDYVTVAGAGGALSEGAKRLLESARSAGQEMVEERQLLGELMFKEATLLAEARYEAHLHERNVSQDERVALAKKGQAIPVRDGQGNIINGRFPMANCDDVKNAAQSIGRGNASNSQLENFVKRVASKLSCPTPFASQEAQRVVLGEPYGLRKSGEKTCVYNTDTGATVQGGCHPTHAEALKHQRALMVNVPESMRGRGSGGRKDDRMAEISDQELSEIRESVRQNAEKITELDESVKAEKTRADRAEDALFTERARNAINEYIQEHSEGDDPLPELPDRAVQRVKESVTGGKLPKTEDGKLDEDRLGAKVREAFNSEAEYLGIKKGDGKGGGNGQVHGMGGRGNVSESAGGNDNGDREQTEAEEKELAESLRGLGSSEKAAEVAARGR
jgi:hypothetical protein